MLFAICWWYNVIASLSCDLDTKLYFVNKNSVEKKFSVLTDMDINYPTGCFDLKCSSAGACRWENCDKQSRQRSCSQDEQNAAPGHVSGSNAWASADTGIETCQTMSSKESNRDDEVQSTPRNQA